MYKLNHLNLHTIHVLTLVCAHTIFFSDIIMYHFHQTVKWEINNSRNAGMTKVDFHWPSKI
jgi:hypothetical protein